jgi:hypothetical protein
METIHHIQESSLSRLFHASSGTSDRLKTKRHGAHAVFAPVAWFVCLVMGVTFWVMIVFYAAAQY